MQGGFRYVAEVLHDAGVHDGSREAIANATATRVGHGRAVPPHHAGPRILAFVAIVVALCTGGYLLGDAGVFSSAQGSLNRQLNDPAQRLDAIAALADQFADELEAEHPTLPGQRGEQTCPATWAAQASTLIGALTPAEADSVKAVAQKRFTAGGWRVDRQTASASTAFSARNRRGLQVTIAVDLGVSVSTLEVTVTLLCPTARGTAPSATTIPPATSVVS